MINKKIFLMAVSILGCAYAHADVLLAGEFSRLKIKTVDENHQAFKVQTVRWWYPGTPEKTYQLPCKAGRCAEWVIDAEIVAPIIIRADASIEKNDDETCWALYSGEAVVDKMAREVQVKVIYTHEACTS